MAKYKLNQVILGLDGEPMDEACEWEKDEMGNTIHRTGAGGAKVAVITKRRTITAAFCIAQSINGISPDTPLPFDERVKSGEIIKKVWDSANNKPFEEPVELKTGDIKIIQDAITKTNIESHTANQIDAILENPISEAPKPADKSPSKRAK